MDPKQERQVKQFFSHHPIDDDQLYLKKFVREHPDQKMAWYLLGREYAAQGKEGKAAYCFAQAGEVYEAFEKRKLNVDMEGLKRQAEAASAPAPAAVLAKRGPSRRRTALLGACLAALLALTASAERDAGAGPAAAAAGTRGAAAPAQTAGEAGPAAGAPGAPAAIDGGATPAVVYTAPGEAGAGGAAAQQLLALLAGSGGDAIAAVGAASPDGRWVYWHVPAKPLAWLAAGGPGGERTVRPLDPQSCSCQPGDADKARTVIAGWTAGQEEQAVLRSAVAAYRQRYGAEPAQPDQLARPYPDNLLPGLTPTMKAQFPIELKAAASAAGAPASQTPALSSDASAVKSVLPGAGSPSPLPEALRIVVDKEQHRLALLSGNRIVRLYAVGLGGDRTPEGEFAITEKVRNPNNKTNGDFGSRGMTLSDSPYAIHGTNKPASIGKDQSLGCVRMGQEDIEELYDMVPHGTKVTIGKGLLPPDAPLSGNGDGGAGPDKGKGKPRFRLPLQTDDSNPKKTYKWLD